VPDDLLRHVIGPLPYSSWWSWLAVGSIVILVVGYTAIFGFTRQGGLPLVGPARDAMVRRRFARTVRRIGDRYRSGDVTAAAASAAVSRELRVFLRRMTGLPAEFMQLDQLAGGALAPAAEVLALLSDAQFNPTSEVDVGAVTDAGEELIRSWT
jgi:hypothetical protein